MIPAVTFVCWMAAQELGALPFPAEVGQEVTVSAVSNSLHDKKDGPKPIAALAIEVESPDGSKRPLGTTDAAGTLRFVPETVGQYVLATDIAGIRVIAPIRVVPARARWLPALVCVPLGLALLWRNLRSRR